jgi:hypothetical protein
VASSYRFMESKLETQGFLSLGAHHTLLLEVDIIQSRRGILSSLARSRLEVRLKSLDDAFLFMLGFTTLVFAILQTVIGGEGAFLVFLPLLISGLLYPFYVGFIRGN